MREDALAGLVDWIFLPMVLTSVQSAKFIELHVVLLDFHIVAIVGNFDILG